MLQVTIPATEMFDEGLNEFINVKEHTLQLEHSLVSLSKWESKWRKPFLSKEDKSNEEIIDYIRCMTITQNVDPNIFRCIKNDIYDKINDYIQDPMSATTFTDNHPHRVNKDVITSEIIYYWMVLYNIPFECQKWHLNRLIILINICNIKSQPNKKMSQKEVLAQNRSLNAARRASLNSRG